MAFASRELYQQTEVNAPLQFGNDPALSKFAIRVNPCLVFVQFAFSFGKVDSVFG
jgi:hypothetical protein